MRVLQGHSDNVRCLSPLADGGRFLSGSEDGTVRKWQLDVEGTPQSIVLPVEITALHWCSQNTVAAGLRNGLVVLVAKPWEQSRHEVRVMDAAVQGLILASDGQRLLAIDQRGTALWLRLDRDEVGPSFQLAAPWESVALAGDRHLAYSVDKTLIVVDALDGTPRWQYQHPQGIRALQSFKNGQLVTACGDGVVRFFNRDGGRLLRQTPPQRLAVTSVNESADGRRFVTASADKTVRIYDTATCVELARFSELTTQRAVFFIDKDRRLLACDSKIAQILDPETGQSLIRFSADIDACKASVSPDRETLTALNSESILLFPLEAHSPIDVP